MCQVWGGATRFVGFDVDSLGLLKLHCGFVGFVIDSLGALGGAG